MTDIQSNGEERRKIRVHYKHLLKDAILSSDTYVDIKFYEQNIYNVQKKISYIYPINQQALLVKVCIKKFLEKDIERPSVIQSLYNIYKNDIGEVFWKNVGKIVRLTNSIIL